MTSAQGPYQDLMRRAATDIEFRRALIADPIATVTHFTGESLPANFSISFIENEADVTFVLPPVAPADGELNDSDLEAVAGGVLPVVLTIASAKWFAGAVIGGAIAGGAYEATR